MIRSDFCVHPMKCLISFLTCLAAIILGIIFLYIGEPLGTVLMAVIFILFAYQTYQFGAFVSITAEGVRKHIFRKTIAQISWDEIQEVGVLGTKVFNKLTPKKTGYLYIYFSPEKLDEQKRFQLALEFPPKHMIYLLHNQEREDLVQAFQSTRLIGFNTGSLKLRHDTQEETE